MSIKISQLPAATALTGADQVAVVQAGTTKKAALSLLPGGGDVLGPATSVDNTLARWNGTDNKTLQGSGVNVSDDSEIDGYRGNVKLTTANSYALLAADSGKVLEFSDGTGVALDMHNNLPKGWCATVVQVAAGAVTFTPASGATRRNRQSHTKSAGQWAMCTLYVRANSGGSAAEYVLGGDTTT
jgi:hypothetical protein